LETVLDCVKSGESIKIIEPVVESVEDSLNEEPTSESNDGDNT